MATKNSPLMPRKINAHLANVYPEFAMMAGIKLEVFTAIGEAGVTVDAVATKLNFQQLKPCHCHLL